MGGSVSRWPFAGTHGVVWVILVALGPSHSALLTLLKSVLLLARFDNDIAGLKDSAWTLVSACIRLGAAQPCRI
ncbi:hypothetical protein EDB81DRAFT_792629 [Dactylonectria macrodidyma]|uniref:Uncharacterized protein n=1 Tax=Dactylonectria macrodidyma TaxID=307937 RepID=A0A9P9J3J8_9HYPO|nr:hypothetical protein EDB81DRAFT_792629 [Dactylonectria macrodidyma]